MNQDKDDKSLEEYLDGGSAESRRYAELGHELPPPELDARILAEAERSVKVTSLDSRRVPPFKVFAWAAIVVLSFSLVLNIVFEQAMQDPVVELEGMAERSDAPVPAAPRAEEIGVPARKAERSLMSEEVSVDDSPAARSGRVMALEESDETADTYRDLGRAEVGAEDKMSRVRQVAPAAAVVAPEPAEAYGAGTVANLAKDKERGAEMMQLVADYLALPSGVEREQSLMKAGPTDRDEPSELRRILDLHDAGREEEALAALVEFRSRYPDHPVSEELRERGY